MGNVAIEIIKAVNVTKKFGDFIAVNDVSLSIYQHETLGMIGPNGAGKTTFSNIITGFFPPDEGSVHFEGGKITGTSPEKIVAMGIVRTFQLVRVFDNLKVYENMGLSYFRKKYGGSFPVRMFTSKLDSPGIREKVDEILKVFALERLANEYAGNMSLGNKKKLEIAMAFITDPKVLTLDEPFAGLSDREIDEIIAIIKPHGKNKTIFLIEHKISKLLQLVDRLVVLHEGRVVASGGPEETLQDPEVRRVYWKIK